MQKQLRTLGIAVAAAALMPILSYGQNTSALSLIGGARFGINSPAALAGSRTTTYGETSSGWGASLGTPVVNVQLVRALGVGTSGTNDDSTLCTTAANGTGSIPSLSNKIAILYRGGGCEFGLKAYNAQLAGAVGVIIINNAPGAPISMGSGANGGSVTIPVFMVTDVDGAALMASMRSGNQVYASMSTWSLGYANDIGIVPHTSANPHAGALPLNQLSVANGNPSAYRMFNGSIAANFGSATQNNIKTATTIRWTPQGGSATQVWTDTGTLASIAPSDSIDLANSANFYNPHATTKGFYTLNSSVLSNGDATPGDNMESRTVFVTDSIYCKGTWDTAAKRPKVNVSYGYTNSAQYSWGPLFYTQKGGQYPAKFQFTFSKSGGGYLSQYSAIICAFKWNDGAGGNGPDRIIQSEELELAAVAYKGFGATDSAFNDFVVPFENNVNGVPVSALKDTSWYYYPIVPSDPALYFGGEANDFSRIAISNRVDSPNREYTCPQYTGDALQIPLGTTSGTFRMVAGYNDPAVPVSNLDITYPVRAVNAALHVSSMPPLKINTLTAMTEKFVISPNPAIGRVNLEYVFKADPGRSQVVIFNGVGQAVAVKNVTGASGTVSFDLDNLPNGSYWMILGNQHGVETRQFQILK